MTFIVQDTDDPERNRTCDTRAEAEDIKSEMEGLGLDVEIIQEGTEPDVVDHTAPEPEPAPDPEPEPTPAPEPQAQEAIPESKDLTDDPIDWVPGHFVDTIQGVPAINRKGYAVLAERYGISVEAEPITLPSETEFEYAEFRAIATTPDGQTYSGFGSAHVARQDGDDKHLLAELAETRAMKRATAWATGVGITAVEELKGEL